MKRLPKRWILFIAVWLVVFLVAPLRYVAQSQFQHTVWPLTLLGESTRVRYIELAQQHPNDAQVWSAAIEEYPFGDELQHSDDEDAPITPKTGVQPSKIFPGQPEKDQNTEKRRRLDLVIDKFPDQAWLIAKRLKYSWGYMYGDRIGGELSDPNVTANRAAKRPSPERQSQQQNPNDPSGGKVNPSKYPNYTPQELKRVLELCQRGKKLEPNNAYYDWTESYFLTLSWRDAEAWRALDAAAIKTGWNDHQLEETRAQLHARELANGRPLLWEEKATMAYAILFPQYARYREYARIVSWQSIKAQRRGDHQQTLRLIGSFAKVSSKIRDSSNFIIERLVAIAMESIVVSNANYDARQGVTPPAWRAGTRAQQTRVRFSTFSAYALAHGQRALAQWAVQDSQKAATGRAPALITSFAGTPFRDACLIILLWHGGVFLLKTLPLCLLAWLLLCGIIRYPRARKLLDWDAPPKLPQENVSRRDILSGALACGGINLLGFVLMGATCIGLTVGVIALSLGQISALSQSIRDTWDSLITAFSSNPAPGTQGIWEGWFYSLSNIMWFGGNGPNQLFYANWLLTLLPVMFGALWCAQIAIGRQQKWQELSELGSELDPDARLPKTGAMAFFKAAFQGRLFHSTGVARLEERPESSFDIMHWFITLLRNVGIGVFWLSWLVAALWPGDDETQYYFIVPLSIAIISGLLLWMDLFSRWRSSRSTNNYRRRAVRLAYKLTRESWLGWVALGSLLFLLTLLLAMPMRARADAALDRYFKLGEIATAK